MVFVGRVLSSVRILSCRLIWCALIWRWLQCISCSCNARGVARCEVSFVFVVCYLEAICLLFVLSCDKLAVAACVESCSVLDCLRGIQITTLLGGTAALSLGRFLFTKSTTLFSNLIFFMEIIGSSIENQSLGATSEGCS